MDFSFKNLVSAFSKDASGGSVVGIDLGSSAIKAVQIKKKGGRAVLETYGELSLGPYAGTDVGRATNLSADKLQEALADLFREASITSKNVAMAIPLSSSLVTMAEMPDLGEKRMAEMIPIEARRYIPLPIGEVMLDWMIIPREEKTLVTPEEMKSEAESGKRVDVFLVAILKDALTKYQSIAAELKFENPFFEIEVFSTIRSALDQGIEPVMVFDMGAGTTKLYIVERGLIRDSHIISRGSQDITLSLSKALEIPVSRAEEMKRAVGLSMDPTNREVNETASLILDYIFSEAHRVLLSFEKKFNKTVAKVVLTGGGSVMKGFLKSAAIHFQSDVEVGDPFSKTVAPAFLSNVLKEVGPDFAVSVGVALRKLQE